MCLLLADEEPPDRTRLVDGNAEDLGSAIEASGQMHDVEWPLGDDAPAFDALQLAEAIFDRGPDLLEDLRGHCRLHLFIEARGRMRERVPRRLAEECTSDALFLRDGCRGGGLRSHGSGRRRWSGRWRTGS